MTTELPIRKCQVAGCGLELDKNGLCPVPEHQGISQLNPPSPQELAERKKKERIEPKEKIQFADITPEQIAELAADDRKTMPEVAQERARIDAQTHNQDLYIQDALANSKKPIQRLGQGRINDIFYYGTSLEFKGHKISAIVTSEKKVYLGYTQYIFGCKGCGNRIAMLQFNLPKISYPKRCICGRSGDWQIVESYNPIRDDLGLNYRTEFNDDAIDYVWSTESIKKYINGDYKPKKLREIFDERHEINKKYVDHLNPTSHSFVGCWTIATFCYTLFEQFGRLYFRAEKASGKTKQARVIKFTSFNPMWITKGTESSMFRDAEATCGTMIVDNMDKLHEDLKRAIEHNIETGWMYDATYRLTNKDTGVTQKFLSYIPLTLNNIFGLDDNTIDKTFEIPMLKSINDKILKIKPTAKNEDWERLRDDVRYWVLDNHQSIIDAYQKTTANFSGREFDVVEGVLTIAKLIGDDIFTEIEQYTRDKMNEIIADLENNSAYKIFSLIWREFKDSKDLTEKNIFLSDLADKLFSSFYPYIKRYDDEGGETKAYINQKKGFSKYISKIIKTIPMFRKGGLSNGRTYITIKRLDLERYMRLQHFIDNTGELEGDKDVK